YYNNGAVLVPSNVTGGSKGVGTINAAGLYVGGNAVLTTASGFVGSIANGVINRGVELDSFAAPSIVTGVRADGTAASPTTLQAADEISSLNAFGYNG